MVENGRLIPLASYTSVAGGVPALTPEERRVCLADTCFAFDETRVFLEDCDGMRRAGEPGACTINRPCAQQYVGKYQSCMVISGRLIVHAPVCEGTRYVVRRVTLARLFHEIARV